MSVFGSLLVEPFKNYFNQTLIGQMAILFARVYPGFDRATFTAVASAELEALEMKDRANQIMQALDQTLPADFEAFADIVLASMHESEDPTGEGYSFDGSGLMGFAAWPVVDLVTHRGLGVPEKALPLLKEVTKRFSAEFAIRPFLRDHTDYTLSVLNGWVEDRNRHVRRLVSEGTRPRLPWGLRLQGFVSDPAPILPFLKALRDDCDDYVRRSVANNLNDIAKDHPDRVVAIAQDWMLDAPERRQRLVRHACRTLFKAGHAGALDVFGYKSASGLECRLGIITSVVRFGDTLEFEISVDGVHDGKIMIDYAIHFMKANGRRSPKIFKWKDTSFGKAGLAVSRSHPIKPITTRRYYEGEHLLEVLINGRSVAIGSFRLEQV